MPGNKTLPLICWRMIFKSIETGMKKRLIGHPVVRKKKNKKKKKKEDSNPLCPFVVATSFISLSLSLSRRLGHGYVFRRMQVGRRSRRV